MTAWSYSSLTAFETCPRQYHITRVLKAVTQPETEEQRWGNEVHKALELRVREGVPLPPKLVQFEPIAAKILSSKGAVFAEQKIGLTDQLEPCGFFDTNCWYRGIIDVGVVHTLTVSLLDYKTGKIKDDHNQLDLFSAAYMSAHPEVKSAKSGYIWLKHGKMTCKSLNREKVPIIWHDFRYRVDRLNTAYANEKWVPNPSGLCKGWCPVGRERCEFWSPKRKSW